MKSYNNGLFRIANVEFLNCSPYRALQTLPWAEYSECSPSECARKLHEDECDLACIPIAEFFEHGGYKALSFGIASQGPVQSVRLFSELPFDSLSRVFVDAASHTSVKLLRILGEDVFGPGSRSIRFYRTDSKEITSLVRREDGGLLIGDEALSISQQFPYQLDLSEEWQRLTGQPFVFAVWAGRPERLSERVVHDLEECLASGVSHREIYARAWADDHEFDRSAATEYVNNCINYDISSSCLEGLDEFIDRGVAEEVLPHSTRKQDCPSHHTSGNNLDDLLDEASQGRRLSLSDAIALAQNASLADLALAADRRRAQLRPEGEVSYIVSRNINYTNICNVYCRFCAFYRPPGSKTGYVLSREQMTKKIDEALQSGAIQILLQGGLNPELGIDYYEELFGWMKSSFPINLHALTADEILHIAKISSLSLDETLARLIEAGLGSLPGGGAEILVDRVRQRIARLKTSAAQWLEVHRAAHRLGITSTCTMMFGVRESWEDRVLHLHKLRTLQDETQGFTAFIAWPFQDENTNLKPGDTSAPEYLRVQALSRLFLDNIPNIQSSWVTQGSAVGQVALFFGANDFGSVMFEENVVSAAGTTHQMNFQEIETQIIAAGFTPWQRDVHYNRVAPSSLAH